MCLEDLRLGRGRFVSGTIDAANASVNNALPADPSRVALLVSSTCFSTFDTNGNVVDNDRFRLFTVYNGSNVFLVENWNGHGTVVLRIEDIGDLITGAIGYDSANVSGQARFSVVSISTSVNAPPLDTYKP